MSCSICLDEKKTTKYDQLDLCVDCYRNVMGKLPK